MEMIITAIAVIILGAFSMVLKKIKKPATPPVVEEIPENKEEIPPVIETPKEEVVPEQPEVEIVPEEPKEEIPPVVEEPKVEVEIPKTEEPKEEIKEEPKEESKPEPEVPEVEIPKEEIKEEPKVEVIPETPKEESKVESPKEEPKPTKPKSEKRKVNSNQIKVLVDDLRIRVKPMGEILGYADKNGYYTYSAKEVKDGITWYKVGECYIGDSGSGDVAVCNKDDYMIFPLKQFVGVSTKFSKSHPAVDFGWNRNYGGSSQIIVAPYKMKVVKTGYDSTVGNYIYAQATYEGKKYTFRFIHLSTVSVSKGDTVKRGATIGKMGNTGSSSNGAHLHFDILKGHRTTLPSDRYANSYDAMKLCYATSSVVIGEDTLADFTVLKV